MPQVPRRRRERHVCVLNRRVRQRSSPDVVHRSEILERENELQLAAAGPRRNNARRGVINASPTNHSTAPDSVPLQVLADTVNVNYCMNCRRNDLGSSTVPPGCMALNLSVLSIDRHTRSLKFCNISKEIFHRHKNQEGILKICCCCVCKSYFQDAKHGRGSHNERWEFVWPAFYWGMLSSPQVLGKVGCQIWSVIPTEWRPWWLESFRHEHASSLLCQDVTIDYPRAVVRDITQKVEFANGLRSRLKLFELEENWCTVLECKVLCPWGCCEFVHKTPPIERSIPVDLLIARSLDLTDDDMKFVTPNPAAEIQRKVKGIRDDYLTFGREHRVQVLKNPNPEWEVLPAVKFENGRPAGVVCRDCAGGSSKMFLYPPRLPFEIFPNPKGETLSPATVRSRVLKTGKASMYTDRHEMLHLQGHVNGVDSIRVTSEPDFNQESQMSNPFQSLSIAGREEIRAYVSSLFSLDSTIPTEIADNLIERANALGDVGKYTEYYDAATYITARTALQLELEAKNNKKPCVWIENESGTLKMEHFSPTWPRLIPHVHAYNNYGARPASLYTLRKNSTVGDRTYWMLFGIMAYVDVVYQNFSMKDEYFVNKVDGYVLSQVAKVCYPHLCRRSGKHYPFKFRAGGMSELQSLAKYFADRHVHVSSVSSIFQYMYGTSRHMETLVLPSNETDLQSMLSVRRFLPEVKCCTLVVERMEDVEFSIAETHCEGWELTFIGLYGTAGENDANIFTRHGKPFRGWWHICANSMFVQKQSQPIPEMLCGKGIIIFVKDQENSKEKMRDQFLMSMGGQASVYCESHTLPLVVHAREIVTQKPIEATANAEEANGGQEIVQTTGASNDGSDVTKMKCCWTGSSKCSKTIGYSCPEKGCKICLCTSHMKEATARAKEKANCRISIECRCEDIVNEGNRSLFYDSSTDEFYDSPHRDDGYHSGLVHRDGSHINNCDCMTNDMDVWYDASQDLYVDGSMTYVPNDINNAENTTTDAAVDCSLHSNHDADIDAEREDLNCMFLDENTTVMNLDEVTAYEGVFEGDRTGAEDDGDQFVPVGFFDYEDIDDISHSSAGSRLPNPQSSCQAGYGTTASFMQPVSCFVKQCATSISGSVILNNCGTLLARGYRKLRASTWQNNFIQRIIATTPGRSIPLLYAEGTLFPSIFWKDDEETGVLGAIPTALLASDKTLSSYGIAGVPTHLRNRLKAGPHLPCPDNHDYLCFAFDAMANLSCRGEDTRLVMRRGLGSYNAGPKKKDDSMMFDSDSIESRPHVNQLCAKMREEGATYFGSHSGNHRDHFGLKKLKAWIDSPDLYASVYESLSQFGCVETSVLESNIKDAIRNASTLYMLRHWQETTELYMDYICRSDERPLGNVVHAWYRHEYQESAGNLSHLHFLLWIDRSTETEQETMERIRGGFLDFISPEELDEFRASGMKTDPNNPYEVVDLAEKFLTHLCSQRCMKRMTNDGDLMCRVVNNGLENPNPFEHSLVEINVKHTEAATDVLKDIGLIDECITDSTNGGGHSTWSGTSMIHDAIRAFKHYPPARASDGKVSACNSRCFAGTKSNQNVVYVTGYFQSRYVAKYSAKIDEANRVFIGAGQRQNNLMSLDVQFLHNTKITGSKINMEKNIAKRSDKHHPTGRAVSIMEMMQVCLGYDMVHTNITFVHVSTKPLGERAGVRIAPKVDADPTRVTPEDLSSEQLLPTYVLRNGGENPSMREWQKLAPSETILLRDMCFSAVSLDLISIFNVRPPELRFVRRVELYYKWFYRDPVGMSGNIEKQLRQLRPIIKVDVTKSAWVDGLGHRVYVRPGALEDVLAYLQLLHDDTSFYCVDHTIPVPVRDVAKRMLVSLFQKLIRYTERTRSTRRSRHSPLTTGILNEDERGANMISLFLGPCADPEATRKEVALPVVWFDPVSPTQSHRFIVHLLLSMGEFDNEMNLFCHETMRGCFEYAKLLPAGIEDETVLIEKCHHILKRYVLDQLVHQPAGTKQFDRFLVAAWQNIKAAILDNELCFREMPSCLYTQLCRGIQDAERTFIDSTNATLVNTVHDNMMKKGFAFAADCQSFINATTDRQMSFEPELSQGEGQTIESFNEQQSILQEGVSRFRKYLSATTSSTKGLIINGGPGTGKTTMMELLILYARSFGLYSIVTAMMSERATQLGGIHISRLFGIPVRESISTGRLAEMAYLDLLRNPERLALLRRLDVLFIDEFGQVSAELLSTMDIIMRRVRNSSQFMGGILIISTYDYMQLPPIKGRPPLLSPYILTSFVLRRLDHSVRAGKDKVLQQIQEYTRLPPGRFAAVRSEFVRLVKEYCTFVSSFDDPTVTPSTLRMFGKKSASRKAVLELLETMKARHGDAMVLAKAADVEASVEGVFVEATEATSRRLSREVKEPKEIWFYERALYEITYNKKSHFNQTQLAVLRSVPTQQHVSEHKPIEVLLAPPGCKSLPSGEWDMEILQNMGWKPASVGICPDRIHYFSNGMQAKRNQYGLKPRIASTIHSGMGQDLPSIITKVTRKEGDSMYHLWSKEQVIVLLSRTHYANCIIFVGDPQETADALADCLSIVSQYSDYMEHVMQTLSSSSSSPRDALVDPFLYNPYRMADYAIPNTNGSYCYNLVSLGDPTRGTSYIGETNNLAHRYAVHNQRNGAKSTRDISLIPWALLGFVTGFENGTRSERMSFEALWQAGRDAAEARQQRRLRPDEIGGVAVQIINRVPRFRHLKYVRCGRVG